ncbi:helix-turn-helix domain-containing protein [Slackia equolifaciens]|nr:helix-turn-helix domain-containing protein [Slackia equolifaciens]
MHQIVSWQRGGDCGGEGSRERRNAALLFEQGWGYKAVSTGLGINRQAVRDWMYAWKAIGTEQCCICSSRHIAYSSEVKLAAVRDRLNGIATVDVMERYGITNRNIVKRWMREFRARGEAAFESRDESMKS